MTHEDLSWLTSALMVIEMGMWLELPIPSTVLHVHLFAQVAPHALISGVLRPPDWGGGLFDDPGVDLTTVLVGAPSFRMVRLFSIIQSRR